MKMIMDGMGGKAAIGILLLVLVVGGFVGCSALSSRFGDEVPALDEETTTVTLFPGVELTQAQADGMLTNVFPGADNVVVQLTAETRGYISEVPILDEIVPHVFVPSEEAFGSTWLAGVVQDEGGGAAQLTVVSDLMAQVRRGVEFPEVDLEVVTAERLTNSLTEMIGLLPPGEVAAALYAVKDLLSGQAVLEFAWSVVEMQGEMAQHASDNEVIRDQIAADDSADERSTYLKLVTILETKEWADDFVALAWVVGIVVAMIVGIGFAANRGNKKTEVVEV